MAPSSHQSIAESFLSPPSCSSILRYHSHSHSRIQVTDSNGPLQTVPPTKPTNPPFISHRNFKRSSSVRRNSYVPTWLARQDIGKKDPEQVSSNGVSHSSESDHHTLDGTTPYNRPDQTRPSHRSGTVSIPNPTRAPARRPQMQMQTHTS